MISLILATLVRLIFPVLMIFSLHLLLRGHNDPGGGFIAGLVTAAAIVLQYVARSSEYVRNAIPVNYRVLLAVGLALAGGTGTAALVFGHEFLTHSFLDVSLGWFGHVEMSSAIGFDLGVYCVVVGATLMLISAVGEEQKWSP